MRYKYLLFDLDGMLVDTLRGVVISAQYALSHFGINASLEELRPFLGPPLRYSFMTFYGLSEEQAVEAIFKYREKYDEVGMTESTLFPEIPALLKDLNKAGYILGVATSKYEEYAKEMLKTLGIADNFVYITGSNLDETISKKHEVIEEALRRFGIAEKQNEVLMIGDMKFDDIGAANAKIDSLGVYTGTAKPGEHEEAGATYIAKSFEDLRHILLNELY
ncbi:MAG: HAD hydrolase-like protein [Clostridia bacterium]|nr:HAD hydrolase-like protein [Clostridia bacterium]